jgi:hypothetical protein
MESKPKAEDRAPPGPPGTRPKGPADTRPKAAKPAVKSTAEKARPEKPDPTRYGDWEKNGRCIDF